MPVDPIATIQAVCAAVESGEISRDRIKESVQRIWVAKQKVCGLPTDLSKLGNPKNLEIAKAIATKAISVYSEISNLQSRTPPAKLSADYLNLLVVDDPLTCNEFLNSRSPAVLLPKNHSYERIVADALTLENLNSDRFSNIFIQIFSRGNPFRGNTNLHEKIKTLVTELVAKNKLEAVVLYGSPYALEHLLPLLTEQIPWGFAYSQQPEAQAAILQKLGF
jgi:beta-glucosidase